ncbi:unnamed protein product, partial [Discosporangium mesarthrocarpum]
MGGAGVEVVGVGRLEAMLGRPLVNLIHMHGEEELKVAREVGTVWSPQVIGLLTHPTPMPNSSDQAPNAGAGAMALSNQVHGVVEQG